MSRSTHANSGRKKPPPIEVEPVDTYDIPDDDEFDDTGDGGTIEPEEEGDDWPVELGDGSEDGSERDDAADRPDEEPEDGYEALDDAGEPDDPVLAAGPRGNGTGVPDEFSTSRLLVSEPGERGTFVPGWAMRACTCQPAQMLVLAQLAYWFGRDKYRQCRARQRVAGDPHVWVVKTYVELGREVGLSVSQVRTALNGLVEAGMVVRRPGTFQGRQAHRLRISRRAVEQAAQVDE
jgi:DNA-binding MarR family transcriptional regulator